MVDAKRKRNHDILVKSGLLNVTASIKAEKAAKVASQRGIAAKKRKMAKKEPLPRRKSSRLAGVQADNIYIENESGGRFTFSGEAPFGGSGLDDAKMSIVPSKPEYFKNRIAAEGSSLSVKDAVELVESKWLKEDSVEKATKFVAEDLSSIQGCERNAARSPTSVVSFDASLSKKIDELSADDEVNVAKVTPDRIYSVTCHPSKEKLIVCGGDKLGYVGMWNVNDESEGDGVHLFRAHGRPVSCLSWAPSGCSLLSASYDGSVRRFDVESQTFQEIFATYDDDESRQGYLGSGLDQGYNYWTQYVCPDPRNASEQCFFMSTSLGTAMHVDLRVGKISFHEQLSEKKINTLSLHRNGHTLASAGLDCSVRLFDIRKFRDNRKSKGKGPTPLAIQHAGKSVNSAFFSPSGNALLSTTMANTLDITKDAHLVSNNQNLKATKRVSHDNHTGRWLTTFMAQWHPSLDIFVVGSMKRPRCIELYDSEGKQLRAIEGEALTAVASRCCFHPSVDKLVVVGGNSSGRMTVLK
jgi:WD40 repeat protein